MSLAVTWPALRGVLTCSTSAARLRRGYLLLVFQRSSDVTQRSPASLNGHLMSLNGHLKLQMAISRRQTTLGVHSITFEAIGARWRLKPGYLCLVLDLGLWPRSPGTLYLLSYLKALRGCQVHTYLCERLPLRGRSYILTYARVTSAVRTCCTDLQSRDENFIVLTTRTSILGVSEDKSGFYIFDQKEAH